MRSLLLFTLAVAVLMVCAAPPALLAQAGPRPGAPAAPAATRLDAQRMREKALAIEQRGTVLPKTSGRGGAPQPATTIVTEREVNGYLAFDAGSQVPVGIAQPEIRILADSRVAGRALVDLDAVRAHHKATGWFDPMSYLTGQVPVAVSGRLTAVNGEARFDLESARVAGVPIPKTLLQEILTYYSRTPATPNGLNLDDPFPLPARISRIDLRPGEAVVVQQ